MLLPFFVADIIATYYDLYWQMLFPYSLLADVIAIVHFHTRFVADVIATVADGIAN